MLWNVSEKLLAIALTPSPTAQLRIAATNLNPGRNSFLKPVCRALPSGPTLPTQANIDTDRYKVSQTGFMNTLTILATPLLYPTLPKDAN